MSLPWRTNINKNVQAPIDCKLATNIVLFCLQILLSISSKLCNNND